MPLFKAISSVKDKLTLSPSELLIKEATSNNDAIISTTTLHQVAELTFQPGDYPKVMEAVWSSLRASRQEWRRIQRALLLSDILMKFGSSRCVQELKDFIDRFRPLQEFRFSEDELERGAIIREKSRYLIEILSDFKKIEQERDNAKKQKNKCVGMSRDEAYKGNYKRNTSFEDVKGFYAYEYGREYEKNRVIEESKTLGYSHSQTDFSQKKIEEEAGREGDVNPQRELMKPPASSLGRSDQGGLPQGVQSYTRSVDFNQPPNPQIVYTQPPLNPAPVYTQPPLNPAPVYTQPPLNPVPVYTQPPLNPTPVYTQPPLNPDPVYTQPPNPAPVYTQPPLNPAPVYTQPPLNPSPVYTQPAPSYPSNIYPQGGQSHNYYTQPTPVSLPYQPSPNPGYPQAPINPSYSAYTAPYPSSYPSTPKNSYQSPPQSSSNIKHNLPDMKSQQPQPKPAPKQVDLESLLMNLDGLAPNSKLK